MMLRKLIPRNKLCEYIILLAGLCSISLILRYLLRSGTNMGSELPYLKKFDPQNLIPNESIFFVLTTGNHTVSPRVLCSVESAARAMPFKLVFLLIRDTYLDSGPARSLLTTCTNIHVRTFHPDIILKQVGLENWYITQLHSHPPHAIYHFSDVVKPALMFLYGGISLDSDIIVQKSLEDLPSFVAVQDDDTVSTAVMKFRSKHPFLSKWLVKIPIKFEASSRQSLGPQLLTSLLLDTCGVDNVNSLYKKQGICKNIPNVYRRDDFYPVPEDDNIHLFKFDYASETIDLFEKSYTVHIWNKLNSDIQPDDVSAYNYLAENFCPTVYSAVDETLYQ